MNIENTTNVTVANRRPEGRFYVVMSVVAFGIAFAGFAPAMMNSAGRTAPLTWAVGLHGLIFTAWLVLLLAQSLLVSQRRISLHRKMGYAGAGLAVLIVGSGCLAARAMARRGHDLSGDLIHGPKDSMDALLVFQLGDLVSFAVLIGLAVWYRNRPQVHKRLVFFATMGGLMPAALAHIIGHSATLRSLPGPVVLIPLAALFFAPAVHDRFSRGGMHPVSLWVAVAMLVWANVRAALIAPSEPWHSFVEWFIR
jgi:hypothetical protein